MKAKLKSNHPSKIHSLEEYLAIYFPSSQRKENLFDGSPEDVGNRLADKAIEQLREALKKASVK